MYKYLCLALIGLLLAGCAALTKPAPVDRIRPQEAGVDRTVNALVGSSISYDIFYSGPVYNPSSLLFIPSDGGNKLKLAQGWERVQSQSKLQELLGDINRYRPELRAIVPTGKRDISEEDVLAFHYTLERASIQEAPSSNRYLILPVPEQNRSRYYGR